VGFGSVEGNEKYSVYTYLQNGAIGNLVLVCAGAIPGSLLSMLLVDRWGRKPILMFGFAMTTLLLLILGSAFGQMGDGSRMALLTLCLFFFNFGEFYAGFKTSTMDTANCPM
jgi:PHS family inorganic phosphate transporter-like MFS transporter